MLSIDLCHAMLSVPEHLMSRRTILSWSIMSRRRIKESSSECRGENEAEREDDGLRSVKIRKSVHVHTRTWDMYREFWENADVDVIFIRSLPYNPGVP